MNAVSRSSLLAVIIMATTLATIRARAQQAAPADANAKQSLTDADRKLLDRLPSEFVFVPPKDAHYVAVPVMLRSVWGTQQMAVRNGWRVAGKKGESDHVYFADGDNVPVPADVKLNPLDFVARCRAAYEAKAPAAGGDEDRDQVFRRMRRDALGDYDNPDLVNAVWLHHLGEDQLAAAALQRAAEQIQNQQAPAGGPPRDRQARLVEAAKKRLATAAFLAMIHAYMVRADDEALANGQRLMKLYPDQAKELGQGAEVVADLERRRKRGTFGKPAPPRPAGFDSWDAAKKVTWLIDSLDEVQVMQFSQPGDVPLEMDSAVSSLIALGDAAVPALIDAVEHDDRLTRSVHFWRDFGSQRTVLEAREAALTAVMSILHVQAFRTNSTGDSFTAHGKQAAKQVAARLRAYWQQNGALPLDERLMKTLTNPKSSATATREAAANLARLGVTGSQSPLNPSGATIRIGTDRVGPNPAVAKFKNPTAAEAILAALDRDLDARDAAPHDQLYDYDRRHIEQAYFVPLMALADPRIAPELARRYKQAGRVRLRQELALAAQKCGDSGPLKQFVDDFQHDRLTIPTDDDPNINEEDQPRNVELRGILNCLAASGLPEANAALDALADPKNPYHQWVAKQLHSNGGSEREDAFLRHPFCLTFYRRELDDQQQTGNTFRIVGDAIEYKGKNFSDTRPIPDYLADPSVRRQEVLGSVCDDAAIEINRIALGVPEAHPLLKDAAQRRGLMKQTLDRFHGKFRRATEREARMLGIAPWDTMFLPGIVPLGRPATADDVAKGRAIFEQQGQGKVAQVKLPAVATLAGVKNPRIAKVLLLQAELAPDGKLIYGAVGSGLMRAIPAHDLTDITPVD